MDVLNCHLQVVAMCLLHLTLSCYFHCHNRAIDMTIECRCCCHFRFLLSIDHGTIYLLTSHHLACTVLKKHVSAVMNHPLTYYFIFMIVVAIMISILTRIAMACFCFFFHLIAAWLTTTSIVMCEDLRFGAMMWAATWCPFPFCMQIYSISVSYFW